MFFHFFEFDAFFFCHQYFFHLCFQNILKTYHETKLTVLKSNFLAHESGQSIFSLSSPLSCFITTFMATNISYDPRWPPKISPNQRMHAIKKEHISNKFYLMHWKNLSFYKMWLTGWLNFESYYETLGHFLSSVWRGFMKEVFCQSFLLFEILQMQKAYLNSFFKEVFQEREVWFLIECFLQKKLQTNDNKYSISLNSFLHWIVSPFQ